MPRYAETCALVTKKGVCHECVELSEYFTGKGENPLDGTSGRVDARRRSGIEGAPLRSRWLQPEQKA